MDFPGSSVGKESVCNAGHPSLIPGSGRSPGEGNGYPIQYSCLENSMDRRAWQATVHGVAKSQTSVTNTFTTFIQVLNHYVVNLKQMSIITQSRKRFNSQ